MASQILPGTYTVVANCPTCDAITSFEPKQGAFAVVEGQHLSSNGQPYTRKLYVLSQCAGCRRGGFASISDRGNQHSTFLNDFYPFSIDALSLPREVPAAIQAEFREAEKCQGMKLYRAASALYRSVLEKTLKANGYTKGNDPSLKDLYTRIDAAASDGIITATRQKRAHEDIRALGNDVLHDDWREVKSDEVEAAHRYMQRILEDFYDDRATVEQALTAKGKIQAPQTVAKKP